MSIQSANEGDVAALTIIFRDARDPNLVSVDPDAVECRVEHGDDDVVVRVYGVDAAVTRSVDGDGVITYEVLESLDRPASYVSGATWTVTYRWVATGEGATSRWRSFPVSVAPI